MEEFFSKYGAVTNCFILQRNGRSKGSGFIEFENEDTAQKVLQLNDDELELDGRKIGISPAEDKKDRHTHRERSRDKERESRLSEDPAAHRQHNALLPGLQPRYYPQTHCRGY